MFMTYFWAAAVIAAAVFAILTGSGPETTGALLDGAAKGVTLTISLAGPLCLWSGLGALMEKTGLTAPIAKALSPLLHWLFPTSKEDKILCHHLTLNVTANLLGLGNAATPMGIRAAERLRDPNNPTRATDGLCRLVVLNTASIQLLPTTVAVVRRTAGAMEPFDILPCVWVSSILSVCAGLLAAKVLGRFWRG